MTWLILCTFAVAFFFENMDFLMVIFASTVGTMFLKIEKVKHEEDRWFILDTPDLFKFL